MAMTDLAVTDLVLTDYLGHAIRPCQALVPVHDSIILYKGWSPVDLGPSDLKYWNLDNLRSEI